MAGDDKVELVLDRAANPRVKIIDAIVSGAGKGAEAVEDKERVYILSGIQEALESLERDLTSLKVLHQQQNDEREAALAKVVRSRKKLLIKLEEYKGDDLELVHKAAAIACETDPTILPELFMVNDDIYTHSHFHSNNKLSKNDRTVDPAPKDNTESESQRDHLSRSAGQSKGEVVRYVLGLIAKSAIGFVGIVSALSLAGFKPEIRRREALINLLEPFPETASEERGESIRCPPGKVLVIDDGKKVRCLVKERVEIPFGSDFDSINFGFG